MQIEKIIKSNLPDIDENVVVALSEEIKKEVGENTIPKTYYVEKMLSNLLSKEHNGVKLIPEFLPKVMKDYPREIVALDEKGNIANEDEVMAYVAKEWAPAFGRVSTFGTTAATPPKSESITLNPWLPENRCIVEQMRIYKENPERAKKLMKSAKI